MFASYTPSSDFKGEPSSLNYFQRMSSNFYEPLDKALELFDDYYRIKERSIHIAKNLEENGTLKQLGMSKEDAEVIFFFTHESIKEKKSPHYVINKALFEHDVIGLGEHKGYVLHLLKALRRLEPISTTRITLYRVIDGKFLKFDDERYKVGNILTWPAFTSTTMEESVACMFAKTIGGEQPIIFEIRGDFVGYNISLFSMFPKEEEVLLEPETTFRVVSIEKDKKDPRAKRIVVEVQSTPLMIKEAVENFAENELREQGKTALTPDNFKAKPSTFDIFQRLSPNFYEPLDKALESFGDIDDLKRESHNKAVKLEKRGILEQLGMTIEEAEVIYSYMFESMRRREMSPEYVINRILDEHDADGLEKHKGYILHLLKALRKLKPKKSAGTTLYRGVNNEKFARFCNKNYKVGNILTWPAFTSTSIREDVAYSLAKEGRAEQPITPIIFEIHGDFVGYNINLFLDFFGEDEILLEPETTFRVVSIQMDVKEPKIQRIVIDVLPTPLIIKEVVDNFAENELKEQGKTGLSPNFQQTNPQKTGGTLCANSATEKFKCCPVIPELLSDKFKSKPSVLRILQEMEPDFYEPLDKAFESTSFDDIDDFKRESHDKAVKLEGRGILEQLGMTIEEAGVMYSYGYEAKKDHRKSPYYIINRILYEHDADGLEKHKGYILHLLKALRKLKPKKSTGTTLYRGIDGKFLKFDDERYKVGNILTWPAFTSTTIEEGKAYMFAKMTEQPIIFEIHGAFVGYSTNLFSKFSEEDEVLLEPETTFKVVSIKNDSSNRKAKRIVVEVLPTPLMVKEVVENFATSEWNIQHPDQKKLYKCSYQQQKAYVLPPNWEQVIDPREEKAYYFNTQAGEIKAEPPEMNVFELFFNSFRGKPSVLDIFQRMPPNFYMSFDKTMESFKDLNEVIEQAQELNGGVNRKKFIDEAGLSNEEAAIISSYTYYFGPDEKERTPFYVINRILARHDTNSLRKYCGFILHLLKALRKLKPIKSTGTTLYRGIDGGLVKFDEDHYKVGNILTWPAFASTSLEEGNAYKHVEKDSSPVIFEIRGDFVGYDISNLSFCSSEKEVLLEPETTFRVVSIQNDAKEPKIQRIVVDVLPTPLIIKEVVENFAKVEKDLSHPRSSNRRGRLPPRWKRVTSPKGDLFYFNTETGETKIDPPEMTMSDMVFSDSSFKIKSSSLVTFQNMGLDFYESLEKAFKSASFKDKDIRTQSQKKVDELEATGALRQLGISREEAEVLFSYTYEAKERKNTPCYIMNKVLAERNVNSLRVYRGYILHLLKALRKLKPIPSARTTLYRGIDGKFLNFDEEHYKVGNILTWPAFTSTALNENISYEFSSKSSQPVIFEIRGDFVGYSIKPFSNFPEEEEILLEPETTFKVVSIEKDTRNPKAKRIKLEVQPTPLMIKDAVENFEITEWNKQHPGQKKSYNINSSYAQKQQHMNNYQNFNQNQHQQNGFINQNMNLNNNGGGGGNYGLMNHGGPNNGMMIHSGPNNGMMIHSGPNNGMMNHGGPNNGMMIHSGPNNDMMIHSGPNNGMMNHGGPNNGMMIHSGPNNGMNYQQQNMNQMGNNGGYNMVYSSGSFVGTNFNGNNNDQHHYQQNGNQMGNGGSYNNYSQMGYNGNPNYPNW